jgi:hypothetical protein
LTIDQSTFLNNQAIGGNGGTSGAEAEGGAVRLGDLNVTLTRSQFVGNSAVAGSGGSGTPIPFLEGTDFSQAAFGGAVQAVFANSLGISGDSFAYNVAKGGNGGAGQSGGAGEGGALNNYYSNLTLSNSRFNGNLALGGLGGPAAQGSSADGGSGGDAGGGAIGNFDYFGNLYGGSATVSGITSSGDHAIGGAGGAGSGSGSGGAGGQAYGGGIFNGGFLTLSSSQFADDVALGGAGGHGGKTGQGGVGGNGNGGGIDSGTIGDPPDALSLDVSTSMFTDNFASGGAGGRGATDGSDGQGFGGGIAILAGPATITKSKFAGNQATTSGDDIYGTYTS